MDSVAKLNLPTNFCVESDNHPKHFAKVVTERVPHNVPRILPHPRRSPDLNPIEHLSDAVERRLRNTVIAAKERLKRNILEIWQSIDANNTFK